MLRKHEISYSVNFIDKFFKNTLYIINYNNLSAENASNISLVKITFSLINSTKIIKLIKGFLKLKIQIRNISKFLSKY